MTDNQKPISPNLHIVLDIGHSSLGWGVLERNPKLHAISLNEAFPPVDVVGCGIVSFRADDCLASDRRGKRRQRRHVRATRKRILCIEKLLIYLRALSTAQIEAKHGQPKKGDKTTGGHAAPWLLAARILANNGETKHLLDWPRLWDVLRWYAHNRGYDGNRKWSNVEKQRSWADRWNDVEKSQFRQVSSLYDQAIADLEKDEALSAEEKEDIKKFKLSLTLMNEEGGFKTATMAETVCKLTFQAASEEKLRQKIFGGCIASNPPSNKRFKHHKAAFDRDVIENEVLRILHAHVKSGALPHCDAEFVRLLLTDVLKEEDRKFLLEAGIKLPRRYEGGLLFGQMVPRFDNRIIAQCPIAYEKVLNKVLRDERDPEKARHEAGKKAKVPNKHCTEFLEYRWAIELAKIKIGFGNETYLDGERLRLLNAEERRAITARVRELGFLEYESAKVDKKKGTTKPEINELRDIVCEVCKITKDDRHNLESVMLHPDAKQALKLVPIKTGGAFFRLAWKCLGIPVYDFHAKTWIDPLRSRFTTQLLRGRELSLGNVRDQLESLSKLELKAGKHDCAALATQAHEKLLKAVHGRGTDRRGNEDTEKVAKLWAETFKAEKLKGRARYARPFLVEAAKTVMEGKHPAGKEQCLELTPDVLAAERNRKIDEQTNNHLVRHRIKILEEKLLPSIIEQFAGGDWRCVSQVTVEVARDLQTMSGLSNYDKKTELDRRSEDFHEISEFLADRLKDDRINGEPIPIGWGLIRKARIAADLGWQCPYTGKQIDPRHLASGPTDKMRMEKDHLIPRTQRLSDAMEAQVVTFAEINKLKSNRTALQFIKAMELPENQADSKRLGLFTERQFRDFVEGLAKIKGGHADDKKRRKRRIELMLLENYEDKSNKFTDADLTKTRHLIKLAALRLESTFKKHLPVDCQGPRVASITGIVTEKFRTSWKMLGLLAQANKEVLNKKDDLGSVKKKHEIREITHLHHALDSITLGLVAEIVGENGEVHRLIHKGKLSGDERRKFEKICSDLRLTNFCCFDSENRLHLRPLSEGIKNRIAQRLAEKRVVQHIPSSMDNLRGLQEETRGLLRVADANGKELWNRTTGEPLPMSFPMDAKVHMQKAGRDEKTGRPKKPKEEKPKEIGKVLGLFTNENPSIRGVMRIEDGNGKVIWNRNECRPIPKTGLENAKVLLRVVGSRSAKSEKPSYKWFSAERLLKRIKASGTSKFQPILGVRSIEENYGVAFANNPEIDFPPRIIVWHKVWHQLQSIKKELAEKFPGQELTVLRKGQLIRVKIDQQLGQDWKIFFIKNNQRQGILLDLGPRDVVVDERSKLDPITREVIKDEKGKAKKESTPGCKPAQTLISLIQKGIIVIDPKNKNMAGVPVCPTTSSA